LSNFSTINQGLYDSSFEHDACGVALVATLNKKPTHEIVSSGLEALRNLEHRGASGSEPDSGDGAGILIQIPDEFFKSTVDFKLPENGFYAAGIVFLPQEEKEYKAAKERISDVAKKENVTILGWRTVPTNPA
jgi:glutamate synthase (NADPH/NADH) large chain